MDLGDMTQTPSASPYELLPLGDSAVIIRFGTVINRLINDRVNAAAAKLAAQPFAGMIECVPAYTSVTVHYDPMAVYRAHAMERIIEGGIYGCVCAKIDEILKSAGGTSEAHQRVIELPVCYGGEYGPDLEEVAEYHGMSADEVVRLHAEGEYRVYMIGFAPGFPYLGGLPPQLSTPRRSTPRTVIPAGSVGIGGSQTGVYPLASPGGWQIIGRTPVALFRPDQASPSPSYLRAGDIVRFLPIPAESYRQFEKEGVR